MESKDIKKIREILSAKDRGDLASLLEGCSSRLETTGRYGHFLYSELTDFEIIMPLGAYINSEKLSAEDREEIYNAVIIIYPRRNYDPDIHNVIYTLDPSHGEPKEIMPSSLDDISHEYISSHIRKCHDKISGGDYSGAVTNARSLLETVCLFLLNGKVENFDYAGKLDKLYKEVSKHYQLSAEYSSDTNFQQLFRGLTSIVNGISGIRNNYGDAHGENPADLKSLDRTHAIFAVNAAKLLAEYLYGQYENLDDKTPAALEDDYPM